MGRPEHPRGSIDPADASAILQRAIDLAADEGEGDELGALTEAELAEMADEVGISRSALAASLAEARAGVSDERGLADRLVGPAVVWAVRPHSGDAEAATWAARRWLEVDQGLDVEQETDGVLIAERRRGAAGAVSAGVRRLAGGGALRQARSVRAATVAIDDVGSICVLADVSNRRRAAVATGTATGGGSAFMVALVATAAGPVALVGLPVAAAIGLGTARLYHRRATKPLAREVESTARAVAGDDDPRHPVGRLILGRSKRRRIASPSNDEIGPGSDD